MRGTDCSWCRCLQATMSVLYVSTEGDTPAPSITPSRSKDSCSRHMLAPSKPAEQVIAPQRVKQAAVATLSLHSRWAGPSPA